MSQWKITLEATTSSVSLVMIHNCCLPPHSNDFVEWFNWVKFHAYSGGFIAPAPLTPRTWPLEPPNYPTGDIWCRKLPYIPICYHHWGHALMDWDIATSMMIADCERWKLSTPDITCFGVPNSTCWGTNLLEDNTSVYCHLNINGLFQSMLSLSWQS